MTKLKSDIDTLIKLAFEEDLDELGDATTLAVVGEKQSVKAEFRSREEICFCGEEILSRCFQYLDTSLQINFNKKDGDSVKAGELICTVEGNARAIITAERTALNFVQHLSGIATLTKQYIEALNSETTKLLDTRKTTPVYRHLEKYAVKCGGGNNHRIGLYDMIMIKDNHRALADMQGVDGIKRSVLACREKYPELKVEVEVDTLEELKQALEAKADFILLDNMTNETLTEAIKMRDTLNLNSKLEASGGITIERLRTMGKLGLDFISVGAITHSARAVDIGLDIEL